MKKNKKIFIIIFQVIYFFITLLFLIKHEQWRDEAQQWMISKESIKNLFSILPNEGHPCVWYIILSILSKTNMPYVSANFLTLIIMNITVFIILKDSPFKWWLKVIIIFSMPFIYFYSVISRSYALVTLIIILLAKKYKERYNNPIIYGVLIAILLNTHVLSIGLAIGIILFEIISTFILKKEETKKQSLTIVAIGVVGIIMLILQLHNSIQVSRVPTMTIEEKPTFSKMLFELPKSFKDVITQIEPINNALLIITTILILTSMFVICKYNKHNINSIFIFIMSFAFLVFVNMEIYTILDSKAFLTIIFAIFSMWIFNKKDINKTNVNEKIAEVIIVSIFIITVILNFIFYYNLLFTDYKFKYSSSKEMAEYVKNNINYDKTLIISCADTMNVSILPYLENYEIVSLHTEKQFKYKKWDGNDENITNEKLINILTQNENEYNNIFLLDTYEVDSDGITIKTNDLLEQYQIIFKTKTSITNENYILYKVK